MAMVCYTVWYAIGKRGDFYFSARPASEASVYAFLFSFWTGIIVRTHIRSTPTKFHK